MIGAAPSFAFLEGELNGSKEYSTTQETTSTYLLERASHFVVQPTAETHKDFAGPFVRLLFVPS